MGFQGYWSTVAWRAWRESLADIRWDNLGRIVIALVPLLATAVATWAYLGDAEGALVRFLATFGATALLGAVLFVVRMLTVPPKMHSEAVERAEAVEADIMSSAASPDLKAIHNLLTRFGAKFLDMRSKKGATLEQQRAWAAQFVTDMTAVFGQESVLVLTRKFPQLKEKNMDAASMDAGMRALSATMTEYQESLTIERISTETKDLNSYVRRRLSELRAEQQDGDNRPAQRP
jgi:hypothetical protein